MHPYPEYKDSGVEWLGDIPSEWDIKPMFSVARESKVSNKGMIEDNLLSLSYGRIIRKDIETLGGLLPESFETYQVVNKDDVIFRLTDLQNDKRSLRTAICSERGIISSAYVAVTPRKIIPHYYSYLMRAYDELKVFYNLGSGMRQSLKYDELKRLQITLPPEDTQNKMVSYLNHETARIDNLIAEKQNFINLLKEKRQALISHAFKIDLNAQCAKLGYFIDLLPGYAFKSEGFRHEPSGIRLLRGVNVGVNSLRWDEVVYWSEEKLDEMYEYEMRVGDIVFGMDRPWIKNGTRVAVVTESDIPSLLVQRVARVRAKKGVLQDYIYYALSSDEFKSFTEADLTGVSVPHISPDQIKDFPLVQRGLKEQEKIVETLNVKTRKIDDLVKEVGDSIELLAEHRTALISAAVTGKIDVRKQV